MAQDLAIAKAALSASLFRADPTSLSRPAVDAFFPLVSSTISQCSRPNVQKCKAWIIDNIAPSRARTAALSRYMAALSKSFDEKDGKKPSARRRRLHVLYLVHDVIHHAVTKLHDDSFGAAWESYLPSIVAAAADFENCPKHKAKLSNLIKLWEDEMRFFTPALMAQIRTALTDGVSTAPAASTSNQPTSTSIKLSKDTPYVVPSFHGDSSTPWYDLPAATWLPHITPNSTKPMMPTLIRPIQLAPGPGDKKVVGAVQDLLDDVERLFAKKRKLDEPHADLNQLGEVIVLDEITGDIIGGETYYGWSRTFCEKMKDRKRRAKNGDGRGRSRTRSRSSSRSRSRSRSSSGQPTFNRRHSSSPSRSPHRSQGYGRDRHRDYDSRSRSRSRSPDGPSARSYRRRSYSRSRSRSPPHHGRPSPPHQAHPAPPPPPNNQYFQDFPPPPPPPGNFPPPPPGYQGPWPPPPPVLPHMGGQVPPMPPMPPQGWFPPGNGMGDMNMNMMGRGGWGSVPPPPPPPQQPYQSPYGRGGRGGGFRGRGRGGYDRGRGW